MHTEDVELNVLRVGKQKRRRRSRRAVSPDVIECDSVLRDDNVIYTLLFSGPFFPIFIRLFRVGSSSSGTRVNNFVINRCMTFPSFLSLLRNGTGSGLVWARDGYMGIPSSRLE